jgi:8-oxo-dGTP diphosphatase
VKNHAFCIAPNDTSKSYEARELTGRVPHQLSDKKSRSILAFTKKMNPVSFMMENIRVSAKAIIIQDRKLMAMHHQNVNGDFYVLPGGGQRNGDTLEATIEREYLEEAGVKVAMADAHYVRDSIEANHEFVGRNPGFHQVEVIFECTLLDDSSYLGQGSQMDTSQIGLA